MVSIVLITVGTRSQCQKCGSINDLFYVMRITWKKVVIDLKGVSISSQYPIIFCIFKSFCQSSFCGATGTLCFGWLTLPMDFKARVDPSLPALCSHLHVMILRVNSEFPGLGLVPVLHLDMMRLLLEWLPHVTSKEAQSLTLHRLSYPGRQYPL